MSGKLKIFLLGFAAGFFVAAIVFGTAAAVANSRNRHREGMEHAERKTRIEAMRGDYSGRAAVEFLDYEPGVRRAADGAAADFDGRLDGILRRFGIVRVERAD